jgi:17 kDa outer membrane surface antigen
MTRLVTGGAILLPLLGLLSATAPASTNFDDIPYLQARINQVLEQEPTGAEVEWRNEATGNGGVIRVLKTYFSSPDAPCRDYERTTRQPGGVEVLVRGTGCREASGRWNLKELQEAEAPSPEPWSPVPPAEESVSPAGQGGQTGQSGGQTGGQTGGQSGAQTQSQTQSQTQNQAPTGGGGQSAGASQTQSGQPTSVLSGASQPEPVAPQAAPAKPKPAAPAPSESAPSPPEIELPTPSD